MEDKEIIAIKALDYVTDNTVIGLGTGSTANFFIKHLANKIKNERLDIQVVASSTVSEIEAQRNKLNLIGIDTLETLDLYVDGADEITNDLNVLKGRGYDLVKEKILAQSANKFIIIADHSKRVNRIGENNPIPIEILKSTWRLSKKILDKFGQGSLRKNAAGDAYAISSAGNYILDYSFDEMPLRDLHEKILSTPGVIETGIFYAITDCALIVDNGHIEILSK
ncbi:ribose 5-phosphate isomerase [Methylophilales bacterium MBRSG12]|uniref:Ribose 5-phosphate isomerase A n=1 Tax=Methylophilales bacterium MBRS-H7 TaxID=1623450 RepID=A0A0H4IXS9_9PROT|nr:ribose 5-phosphate isomerase [Methylophilales bacterium MBRSF5]AKO65339.1 ribose 5-phosphate isomerase [Methylophilales bacterium MBRS-H7]AKO66658.1 ribose 5-phosphate isomerase [Methylophilales bacterium MBRSG12]